MVSWAPWSRCVRGMPAATGPASADEMPGMISNFSPCLASSAASSPALPKIMGSPPLSLTTVFPARV